MGGVDFGPCLDDWENLSGSEIGESEVVRGRES